MKPATVTEARATIEWECTKIPNAMFGDICDSIASHCQQYLRTKMDVSLKTHWQTKIISVDYIKFKKWNVF